VGAVALIGARTAGTESRRRRLFLFRGRAAGESARPGRGPSDGQEAVTALIVVGNAVQLERQLPLVWRRRFASEATCHPVGLIAGAPGITGGAAAVMAAAGGITSSAR
jgi:hypothetical protein